MLAVYEISGSGLENHMQLLRLSEVPCQSSTDSQTTRSKGPCPQSQLSISPSIFFALQVEVIHTSQCGNHCTINYISVPEIIWQLN